jgi:ABC-type antimicrobial peptide transport system permease subunit
MLSVTTMRQVMSRSVARQRFYATLLGGFAIAAVSLAMLGLYAVMAQLVAQRRREMAVRVALGARGVDVFQMLLGQGMRLVLTGLALGVVGAMAATRLLSNLLFGVGATDIPTFIGVNALVVVVAAGAISIQAWRAARLDPMRVLGDR